MSSAFAARLLEAARQKDSRVVVGLDPQWEWIPPFLKERAEDLYGRSLEAVEWAITRFNEELIDAVAPVAVAVKLQVAFYTQFGWRGFRALETSAAAARKRGLLVIIDGKFNDIASSAQAYASGYLGTVPWWDGERQPGLGADAVTVNPFLGSDGLRPFLEECDRRQKGMFVLLRTSNPSAGELQGLPLAVDAPGNPHGASTVTEALAHQLESLNTPRRDASGYGPVGAVVGATYPQEAEHLRQRMPSTLFLLPGFGAQGAGVEDVLPAFDQRGWGAVVNSSRGICFAYGREPWSREYEQTQFAQAALAAAEAMRAAIQEGLRRAGKWENGTSGTDAGGEAPRARGQER